MKITLPYLMRVPAYRYRNGVRHHAGWRYYVRRGGKHIRIRGEPGGAEFFSEYHEALGRQPRSAPNPPAPKTWRWLCEAYMRSPEWGELAEATRAQRKRVLEHTWAEPLQPGGDLLMGECPIASFGPRHVRALRDRKRDHPEAANHRLKVISSVYRWAIEAEHAESNPAKDVQNLRPLNKDGHHTWTIEEVRQFERRHPIGTKAHLALKLFLFTGARISDVARLGRPNVHGKSLRWVMQKGGEAIEVPILPELQAVIDATPLTGMQTWIVTQHGRPHSAKGLGNWFRRRCDEAGLHHCSAHGLRKAGATIAAENGASLHQLMAIFGWQTAKQAIGYTRKVERRKLAGEAMALVVPRAGNGSE